MGGKSGELTDNSKINIVNKFSINLYNAQNKYQRKSYCKNRLSFTILYIECSQSHTFSTLSQKKDAKYFMVAMLLDFSCVCVWILFVCYSRGSESTGSCNYWNIWSVISLASWVCLSFSFRCSTSGAFTLFNQTQSKYSGSHRRHHSAISLTHSDACAIHSNWLFVCLWLNLILCALEKHLSISLFAVFFLANIVFLLWKLQSFLN